MAGLRTQEDVLRLPAPKVGETVYFDEGRPKDRATGLALRVRSAGSRKFVFFYRLGGRLLKYTIGDASSWPLAKARETARKLRVKVDSGENPATEKATKRADAAMLFSQVKQDYLDAKASELRERSHEECKRHMGKHWKTFDGTPLKAIDRNAVASRLRTLTKENGPMAANRARSTLSAMFAWAIGEGLCDTNPVTGTNRSDEVVRERVLTDAELVTIWKAANPETDYGRIVRLLMLTAQRREEIGGLRWPEIDQEARLIRLPGERTKNHRPHDVPLSEAALALLNGVYEEDDRAPVFGRGREGFSGWSKAKSELDAVAKIKERWTLHDLRRTAATRMADLGVQPHVIEAVLNHISGHKGGVAGIYNRSTYAKEKREALDLWANHLMVAVAKAEGANVTKLHAKSAAG
jgi:integrase